MMDTVEQGGMGSGLAARVSCARAIKTLPMPLRVDFSALLDGIRIILWACACLAAHSAAAPPVFAQDGAAPRFELLSSGSDESLWILVGEWSHEKGIYNNWLAWFDKTSSDIHPLPGPLPQSGRPQRLALAGQDLHVFFAGGTHFRYAPRLSRPELRLPDQTVPDALAGELAAGLPRIWAVVKASSAESVASEYQRALRLRGAQTPAQTRPDTAPETPPDIGANSAAYHVVSYNGDVWRPEVAAPVIDRSSERVWLAVADGRIHLFWQRTRQDADIQYACYEQGRWTSDDASPAIHLAGAQRLSGPLAEGFVGIGNRQIVFIAMVPAARSLWRPHAYTRPERAEAGNPVGWTETPALQHSDGQPLLLPAGSTASVFSDQIAIVRSAAKNAEVAFWRISGGRPEQPFTAVPTRRSVLEPGQPGYRDLRTALALGALLLLVFWRRHSTFASPVALPAGFALASVARRAVAALLDLLPAAVLVGWWFHPRLHAALDELAMTTDPAQIDAAWPDVIFWPSLAFRLVYLAWCIGFELIWSRTPGKWLLGCSVISESGPSVGWMQTVVRNATKLLELELYLPISLPLLLLVFLTRNRQRVGDLLAHTLVVESAPILEGPAEDDRP